MNRQEPYPLTANMMWIAAHPSEGWLPNDLYQFKTDPIGTYKRISTTTKALTSGYSLVSDDESVRPSAPKEQFVLGVSNDLIKHLASKIKVSDEDGQS